MWCSALWCRRFRIHRYVAAPFVSVQSKHQNFLFRYRTETIEKNVLFWILPKPVSVPVSLFWIEIVSEDTLLSSKAAQDADQGRSSSPWPQWIQEQRVNLAIIYVYIPAACPALKSHNKVRWKRSSPPPTLGILGGDIFFAKLPNKSYYTGKNILFLRCTYSITVFVGQWALHKIVIGFYVISFFVLYTFMSRYLFHIFLKMYGKYNILSPIFRNKCHRIHGALPSVL